MSTRPVSLPRRLYRITRLALHFARGRRIVRTRFARLDPADQDREIAAWSQRLLSLLRVEVRVHGPAGDALPSRCMVVANHLSWLDIFVIHAHRPGVFVAKEEIRDWPLLGALVRDVGTLFISRGSRTHARRTNERIARTLAAGRTVAVFPEGSTTTGEALARFHAALLQPAIEAQAALVPLGLRYRTPVGEFARAALYVDDMSFMQSLWRIVSQERLVAEVHVAEPVPTQNADRRKLARATETAIARALGLPLAHSRTETPADPPAARQSADRPIRSPCPDPAD